MSKTPSKKALRYISTRIPDDAYQRLLVRVDRASKKSGVPTNLGAVLRALIVEHA